MRYYFVMMATNEIDFLNFAYGDIDSALFRLRMSVKTVSLEMRPMFHKTDARIRAHVFLCMLAYYLQWHMIERLAPLLDEQRRQLDEGEIIPAARRWTLQNIIETLKARRSETASLAGVSFEHITDPTADQARLLDLLGSPAKESPSPVQAP